MPESPTFDKIAALYIVQTVVGQAAENVVFWSVSDEDEVTQRRAAEGFYLLDVGGNKYQERETGSAVETVCQDFEVTDPNLRVLIETANKNNATGNLKSFPFSIVWALRESYQIGYENAEVVRRVLDVLDYCLKGIRQPVMEREASRVIMLLEKVGQKYQLFTLSALIHDMVIGGAEMETVQEEVDWWREVFWKAQEARERANHEAEEIPKIRFRFTDRQIPGCLIHTDSPMLWRPLQKKFALVIFRTTAGNVSVKASPRSQLDLSAVAARLNDLDQRHQSNELDQRRQGQEVWHFDEKSRSVLNGSPGWRAPSTVLEDQVIINVVTRLARRPPRPQR